MCGVDQTQQEQTFMLNNDSTFMGNQNNWLLSHVNPCLTNNFTVNVAGWGVAAQLFIRLWSQTIFLKK